MTPPPTTEERLSAIETRNARVTADKSWETSWMRRGTIAMITYFTAAAVLYGIGASDWALNAIVPVAGYLLSTLSLPAVRRVYERTQRGL